MYRIIETKELKEDTPLNKNDMMQTTLQECYLIKERSEKDVQNHGSVDRAIEHLKSELEELYNLWSMYSSDCLGHGITCTRLKIYWLEQTYSKLIASKQTEE